MQMLNRSKDFRGQNLWVLSQLSQCGVDPREHARSRPMRLNISLPFSHGALSRCIGERTIVAAMTAAASRHLSLQLLFNSLRRIPHLLNGALELVGRYNSTSSTSIVAPSQDFIHRRNLGDYRRT